jgi:hypothetical protein
MLGLTHAVRGLIIKELSDMSEQNIYAPPRVKMGEIRESECTRDGKHVIVPTGSDLPPRCICCNAPAELPAKSVKVYWHSSFYYLLIPVNILLYLSRDRGLIATCFFVPGFISLIGAGFASRKVFATKITSEYARLGGCKEPFLASLE